MNIKRNRDEFSASTKLSVAKRAGFLCSICKSITVGPSDETEVATTNGGEAAHICAAASGRGARRYDPRMSSAERTSIENAIWLCRNHAKQIDDDEASWPADHLRKLKARHEKLVKGAVGIPAAFWRLLDIGDVSVSTDIIVPREYAILRVGDLEKDYRSFLSPILRECELTDDHELGVLMCTTTVPDGRSENREVEWTVFVQSEWLRWLVSGEALGFKTAPEIPSKEIYGRIPGWPDKHYEFLKAMTITGTTFAWSLHRDGYLVLSQVV